jgi:prenyl protein peptidase
VPLFLLSRASKSTIIFGTPIIFGLAHIHHFYEFRITHPNTPIGAAVIRSLFQLGYTTLFGSYATFLYLRTGSLLAAIFVHSFCNWMGLPKFWGRVGAVKPLLGSSNRIEQICKRDEKENKMAAIQVAEGRSSICWTIAYYVLLLLGAFGFWKEIWALTESSSALTQLREAKS